ncbi:CdaR family protein [Alkaliflexus imshenetskii]|uniref:CdaR family protein n=1 Tax=Alkaliflexus imshenetskii TaxID=286730 RepID=UPI000478703D|nr:CdaR family protein [Alkaliflexus imshenetskii]
MMKSLIAKLMDLLKIKSEKDKGFSFSDLKKNRDAFVFFIFLMISTAFWFLNALRDDYITEFSYPVRFVNIPDNQTIVDASDTKINLRVRANGYTILRQFVTSTFLPVSYDVSQLRRINRNGDNQAFILSRDQYSVIAGQLLLGVEVLSIYPDTVFVALEKVLKKTVPIKLNAEIGFEKQFLLAGDISFQPESVVITGPQSIVDTITSVYTKSFSVDRLRDTLYRQVSLDLVRGLSYSHNRAKVTIPVEPFSEKVLSIPIEVPGLPDSLRLKTFPSQVSVTFRAGISQFERISDSDFRAVIDVESALGTERPHRLRVRLETTPTGIQSVDISPLFVEYLIERVR